MKTHEITHDCGKFTYEYFEIFYDEDAGKWFVGIDSQSGTEIFFCPFCGEHLEERK